MELSQEQIMSQRVEISICNRMAISSRPNMWETLHRDKATHSGMFLSLIWNMGAEKMALSKKLGAFCMAPKAIAAPIECAMMYLGSFSLKNVLETPKRSSV